MKNIIKRLIMLVTIPFILPDYFKFKAGGSPRFPLRSADFFPRFLDKTVRTAFDRHYIYHTAWAARKMAEISPKFHIDISSSLYFSGIASAFIPIKFYDYRPAELSLSNFESNQADLLSLPFADNSIESLSCMHTVEHVGLGRYGDRIDPDGDLKAIAELKRVLSIDGNLLFVVPVGEPRIEYNAHRIYSYEQILSYFKDCQLKEFMLIPEKEGSPVVSASAEDVSKEKYACGCFWFVKK
jgi:SAM-dependent methyltransferase